MRVCRQKPDDRLVTAKALHALLDPASATYGGDDAVDAFLAQGGPSILRYRLDSMDGDWMVEARNGTTDLIDTIARLPGLQKTCVCLLLFAAQPATDVRPACSCVSERACRHANNCAHTHIGARPFSRAHVPMPGSTRCH